MIDNFQQEIEKVNRLEKLIKSDISSRNDLVNNDKSTAMIDANIRSQLDQMKNILTTLLSQTTKTKNNLSTKEINRRLEIIQDNEQQMRKYSKLFDNAVLKSLEKRNSAVSNFNTFENTTLQVNEDLMNSSLTNKDLLKLQKDKIKEQDEALEEFHKLLKQTTRANREINNELEQQSPMLKSMEPQMDKLNSKIKKAHGRLDKYIEKSSNTCLMTIICIEILMFLFLISVF